MIELMPVSCWVMATPDADEDDAPEPPIGQDRLQSDDVLALLLLGDAFHLTEFGDGTILGTDGLQDASASSWRPFSTSQRGDSGIRSMPTNSAMAGSAHTPNMKRHTPSTWPHTVPMTALTDEGGELSGDDRQLVAPGDRAADLVGRQLGQEDRDHRGGATDREPQDDSAGDEDTEPGRRERAWLGSGR